MPIVSSRFAIEQLNFKSNEEFKIIDLGHDGPRHLGL